MFEKLRTAHCREIFVAVDGDLFYGGISFLVVGSWLDHDKPIITSK